MSNTLKKKKKNLFNNNDYIFHIKDMRIQHSCYVRITVYIRMKYNFLVVKYII